MRSPSVQNMPGTPAAALERVLAGQTVTSHHTTEIVCAACGFGKGGFREHMCLAAIFDWFSATDKTPEIEDLIAFIDSLDSRLCTRSSSSCLSPA